MKIVPQLRTELKEAMKKRDKLLRNLQNLNFCITVFKKELSFRRK